MKTETTNNLVDSIGQRLLSSAEPNGIALKPISGRGNKGKLPVFSASLPWPVRFLTETTAMDALYSAWRDQMLDDIAVHARHTREHIGKDTLDGRVMSAVAKVPRHEFVPTEMKSFAYINRPLPIGCGKTISQPFIVALMTDLLDLAPGDNVLEIGTGLGYQAAVLAELVKHVYTIEILEDLGTEARRRLTQLGYKNISPRIGDGYSGWPEHAPFDAIIVTAAPDLVPPPLIYQLKPGGKMIIPAGATEDTQQLLLVIKNDTGKINIREILPVRFSELTRGEDD